MFIFCCTLLESPPGCYKTLALPDFCGKKRGVGSQRSPSLPKVKWGETRIFSLHLLRFPVGNKSDNFWKSSLNEIRLKCCSCRFFEKIALLGAFTNKEDVFFGKTTTSEINDSSKGFLGSCRNFPEFIDTPVPLPLPPPFIVRMMWWWVSLWGQWGSSYINVSHSGCIIIDWILSIHQALHNIVGRSLSIRNYVRYSIYHMPYTVMLTLF